MIYVIILIYTLSLSSYFSFSDGEHLLKNDRDKCWHCCASTLRDQHIETDTVVTSNRIGYVLQWGLKNQQSQVKLDCLIELCVQLTHKFSRIIIIMSILDTYINYHT